MRGRTDSVTNVGPWHGGLVPSQPEVDRSNFRRRVSWVQSS